MNTIETEYEGIKLVGEIICQREWYYSVKLIEPIVGWHSGCSIPYFARGSGKNYLGENGHGPMKRTLVEIYKKVKKFYSDEKRFRRCYKDYLEEIELLSDEKPRVKKRIINKLNNWLMNTIFGYGEWNINDEEEVLKILRNEK